MSIPESNNPCPDHQVWPWCECEQAMLEAGPSTAAVKTDDPTALSPVGQGTVSADEYAAVMAEVKRRGDEWTIRDRRRALALFHRERQLREALKELEEERKWKAIYRQELEDERLRARGEEAGDGSN